MFTDVYGFIYEVKERYADGSCVLTQTNATPCPWIIRTFDGQMFRFYTQTEMREYAKKNHLLKKGKKYG